MELPVSLVEVSVVPKQAPERLVVLSRDNSALPGEGDSWVCVVLLEVAAEASQAIPAEPWRTGLAADKADAGVDFVEVDDIHLPVDALPAAVEEVAAEHRAVDTHRVHRLAVPVVPGDQSLAAVDVAAHLIQQVPGLAGLVDARDQGDQGHGEQHPLALGMRLRYRQGLSRLGVGPHAVDRGSELFRR